MSVKFWYGHVTIYNRVSTWTEKVVCKKEIKICGKPDETMGQNLNKLLWAETTGKVKISKIKQTSEVKETDINKKEVRKDNIN